VSADGSLTVQPSGTTTYTLTAANSGGTVTAEASVTVNAGSDPVHISASRAEIRKGESFTLSWTFSGSESAYIDNGVGTVSENGSSLISPDYTTTYTITASGASGPAAAKVRVTVLGSPDPQPEGSFGKKYEDLIPRDATVDSYDPKRFSVITGLVLDMNGSPLPDVGVTVHARPEYGTVFTDAEGRFSVPVEGGSVMKVLFRKAGLLSARLSAQRQVYVPWNDIAVTETLRLVPEDTAATTVTFDGNPDTVVTHRSTAVTDGFGTRSATLVFHGDNRAYLLDSEGNDVLELTSFTARATEYTTPDSMPAKLPPTTAYTYCTELSADGAANIRFENPVIVWTDNFLGFDVGESVPSGYYDRNRGEWVPSQNGKVVRLLDTDGDGTADAFDADGDGSADGQAKGLGDPQRYAPGSEFWRVEVTHFTPWDFNWCSFMSLLNMLMHGMPDADEQCDEDCQKDTGSFVEERSRIFHEDIPIPGTDMSLHYVSDRVPGYRSVITVPASGTDVPLSVKRIIVRVGVAGRVLEEELTRDGGESLDGRKAEFVWDGKDFLGRPVTDTVIAHIGIGFVYDSVYMESGYLAMSFGMFGTEPSRVPAREEVISWQRSELAFHRTPQKADTLAEGWSLSDHHQLSPLTPSLIVKGDGTTERKVSGIIDTFVHAYYPTGVVADAAGNLFAAERENDRVLRVDTNGIITAVAGTGTRGYNGDGIPAAEAMLTQPDIVAVDASGNLFIMEGGGHRVRKVDTDGIITTVAGTGTPGYNKDGIPAVEARLNFPSGLALDDAGNIYISDSDNSRIRKVDTDGIITTVAGSGVRGYYGDGISATEAKLRYPKGLATDAEGNLYIADTYNRRIRKVDTSGIITTVAGTGIYGYSGDGGPAVSARFMLPLEVLSDRTGNLYICDQEASCIRKVGTDGIIITVAGTGAYGYSGDDGPAVNAMLDSPMELADDAAGNLYIADTLNSRIRKISFSDIEYQNVAEIIFPDENGMNYIFSGTGKHIRTLDLNTGTVLREFGYDGEGRLVTVTDPRFSEPRVTRIERDGNGVPTAIISPDGLGTALTVDGNGQLTRIAYPGSSKSFIFEYAHNDGLLTKKTEPEGNVFDHVFDNTGRVTYTTDQEGGHWEFARVADADGTIRYTTRELAGDGLYNITSYTDQTYSYGRYTSEITGPTGAETVFGRSADGLKVTKSLSCGTALEFEYGADPQYQFGYVKKMTESAPSGLTKVTERSRTYGDTDSDGTPDLITETVTVNNRTATSVHDTVRAKKTVTSPAGRSIAAMYDPATLLTSEVSVSGLYGTFYGYDAKGRLSSVNTGTRAASFAYNGQGNIASVTDAENSTFSYDYDAAGRVTAVRRPDMTAAGIETVIRFVYDDNGNMTVLTNPSSVAHGFGFNGVNLNSSYTTPLSGNYTYTYDKARRLTQKNFPSGAYIRYNYDPAKLVSIGTSEGDVTDFAYLPCGTKVQSAGRGSETVTYGYDGSLVTSETLTGTLNRTLSYTYNNDFAAASFTYAGGTAGYTYDSDGLLTGAGDFGITRNAGNGLPESVSGGALSLSRTFSGYGEADAESFSVNGAGLFSRSVVRDSNGRITQKTESFGDGTTAVYEYDYDAVGRLLSVTKDGTVAETYQYDSRPYGTRTYQEINGVGKTLSYSDEDHLLTAGSTAYQHDTDGFLVSRTQGTQVTSYDYSLRGELLRVGLPDGTVIEYVHDPLGRRIAKKVNGVVTEKYLWQGLTRLLAVYNADNTLKMRFGYADGRMPVAVTKGGATYYLAYDQVGTLKAVADASGNVVKKIEYDTFGNILGDSNPTFAVPFGFAGGLYDKDTKLVRFGYRETGRWTAKDPILFAGGDSDLYGYCLSDPVNFADPEGLASAAAISLLIKAAEAALGASLGSLIGAWVYDVLFNEADEDDPCEDDKDEDEDIPDIPEEPVGGLGKKLDDKWLKEKGIDPHEVKEGGSMTDIYKDKAGNLWEVRKSKKGVGGEEPRFIGHIDSF
ncbi:MAG: hypothetical protein BWK80_50500, partial [Desulfobacteraceae bacterium IS3]